MDSSYKLVWADEFDSEEFDPQSWNLECHESSWINDELQEYTDNKKIVFIKDSCAIIRPDRTVNYDGSVCYYSAYITTSKLKRFKYGRFEARIKVPRGRGLLPAFKLIADSDEHGKWPSCGDIGVMEILGQDPSQLYGSVRFGSPISQRQGCERLVDAAFDEDFHVYACEWSPNEISFFIDGKKYYSTGYWFSRDENGNEIAAYPAPFNKPFAICFHMSIGSMWAGNPDLKTEYGDKAQMFIDYIRVYQKDQYDENVVRPERVIKLKEPDETGNYLMDNPTSWEFQLHRSGQGKMTINGDEIIIDTEDTGDEVFSIQVLQAGVSLKKGETYRLSFDACAETERQMAVAVTAPDVGWQLYLKYTPLYLDTMYQHHDVCFKMISDSDDNARVEFNAGNQNIVSRIKIKNIRLEKVEQVSNPRKILAVCSVWGDAENFSQFVSALQDPKLTEDNLILGITFNTVMDEESNDLVYNRLIEYLYDFDLSGIIIFSEMIKSQAVINNLIELGHKKGVPVFSFERNNEGCINSAYDYASGFRSMVNHVLDVHGCKDVLMFAGFRNNYFSDERIAVLKECMREHNLEFSDDKVLYGDFWNARAGIELTEYFKRGGKLPDAIVCANDSMAVGVCDCLVQHGYKVPDDVIVTGFDGIVEAKSHNPIISTCEPDYQCIVSMLANTINNWDETMVGVTRQENIPYIPKLNQSCGCPSERDTEWYDIISRLASDNQDYFRHVLEMGHYVTSSIHTDNFDDAAKSLSNYLWLWSDYYYFIGLSSEKGYVDNIFYGENGVYNERRKYYNYKTIIPELNKLTARDSQYKVVLLKQLKSNEESFGVIVEAYKHIRLRDQQRFEELALYVSAVIGAIINKRKLITAMNKIERLSESDYLTGLYNRRGFLRQVQDMLDNPDNMGKVISMFSIDMDGLKMINDNYGHNEGDAAIKVLARALNNFVGNKGICARYGGDEFAVCIVGDKELLPEYVTIHERISNHCAIDPEMKGKPYIVDASIGISERRIRPGVSLEDLISFSDTAMYIDKQSRKMK